jgi:hypothetical protein
VFCVALLKKMGQVDFVCRIFQRRQCPGLTESWKGYRQLCSYVSGIFLVRLGLKF